MSIERANIVWTAKQMAGMFRKGRIDFDHIIQRGEVWERKRKSYLIESLVEGYPVPTVYAKRKKISDSRGDNVYVIMDGKQRLTSIIEFLNDEYYLEGTNMFEYEDEEGNILSDDFNGKKFSELPESLQDTIKDYNLSVMYFDTLTFEQERELFRRLNNGKPLTAKNKLLAECKDINRMIEFASENKVIDEMTTKKGKENKTYISLIMKAWAMLNVPMDKLSFKSKDFNPLVEETEITDEQYDRIREVFTYIKDVHDVVRNWEQKAVAKKIYKETVFVSLVPIVDDCIKRGYEVDDFAAFIIKFFTTEMSDKFNEACSNAVASNTNIIERHVQLDTNLQQYKAMEEVA